MLFRPRRKPLEVRAVEASKPDQDVVRVMLDHNCSASGGNLNKKYDESGQLEVLVRGSIRSELHPERDISSKYTSVP
jgi:hypothetical protein